MKRKSVSKMSEQEIKEGVRKTYAKVATSSKSCCNNICCDVPFLGGGAALANMLGYDIEHVPKYVTESFAGCGNPIAFSDIKEGESVLDLGSGTGLDAFVAAKKVGGRGKAIGLDMTPEIIKKANENAYKLGLKNVEFILGDIENMPIKGETIDVVISNCVINLAPDKHKAFREAYRVLRPGGRIFISDTVLDGKLPEKVQQSFEAYASCISGALKEQEYIQAIKDAGFVNVETIDKAKFMMEYISSDKIRAYKPSN